MDIFKEFIEAVPTKVVRYFPETKQCEAEYIDSITTRAAVNVLMSTISDRITEFKNWIFSLPRDNWQIVFEDVTERLIYAYGETRLATPKISSEDLDSIGEVRRNLMLGLYNITASIILLAESFSIVYPNSFVERLRRQGFEELGLTNLISSDFPKLLPKTSPKTLPMVLNTDKLEELRSLLIEMSYISNQTEKDVFLQQFGQPGVLDSIPTVLWIKKNRRSGMPSKKSLLDLLVLIGYNEKQIRENINNAFSIDGGKRFVAQDYSNYKDWKRDVISEYHTELEGIVNKIKNKTT